jgi:hypothetical protein
MKAECERGVHARRILEQELQVVGRLKEAVDEGLLRAGGPVSTSPPALLRRKLPESPGGYGAWRLSICYPVLSAKNESRAEHLGLCNGFLCYILLLMAQH